MTSITFPCGCEINETHVIAMCVLHVKALKEAERHEKDQENYRMHQFMADVGTILSRNYRKRS
jgi:hypothetical protein